MIRSFLHAACRTAAAMCLLAAAGGCAIKKPTVTLKDVDIDSIGFRQIDVVFDVAVHNPNDFQLSFSSLSYELEAAGVSFGRGAMPGPLLALSAGESTVVRMPVTLEYSALAEVFDQAGQRVAVPYTLSGKAAFNWLGLKIPVPLKHSGTMPRLRKPDWRFSDVELVQGPPSWLKLTFEVDNPNDFSLPLERLTGAVKYGEDVVVRVSEPDLQPIAPDGTGSFSVMARVDGVGATKALAGAIISRKKFSFEGELKTGAPEILRRMLLQGRDAGHE